MKNILNQKLNRKRVAEIMSRTIKENKPITQDIIEEFIEDKKLMMNIFRSISLGIIVIDKRNIPMFGNKTVYRLIPIDESIPRKKPIWEYIKTEEVADYLESNLLNNSPIEAKDFNIKTENINRIVSIYSSTLVHKQHFQGNIIIIEDVTNIRAQQDKLKRAENLASLTNISAGIAHEIKNPLGAISIHLQLLEKQLKLPEERLIGLREDLLNYVDIINSEINRLNQTVTNFLTIVRPGTRNFSSGNLIDIIQEIISLLSFELKEKKITLKETLDKNTPNFNMDQTALKQAILNIIQNSIQAMPKGGELIINLNNKGNCSSESCIYLQIIDNGIGMSEETQKKIFQPYFTTRTSGSGLGLSLVDKIISRHNGEIFIKSEVNLGTMVIIVFPLKKDPLLIPKIN